MLFHLAFPNDTLLGALGKDGRIYWAEKSLCDLLQRSPFRSSLPQVFDIASNDLKRITPQKYLRYRMIIHEKSIQLLKKSKDKNIEFIYKTLSLYDFSVKVLNKGKMFPYLKICLIPEPGAKKFLFWINDCKNKMDIMKTALVCKPPTLPSPSYSASQMLIQTSTSMVPSWMGPTHPWSPISSWMLPPNPMPLIPASAMPTYLPIGTSPYMLFNFPMQPVFGYPGLFPPQQPHSSQAVSTLFPTQQSQAQMILSETIVSKDDRKTIKKNIALYHAD